MRVDESWHDHFISGVDDFGRQIDFAARSDVRDDAVADDHNAVADHTQLAHFIADTRSSGTCDRHQFGNINDSERAHSDIGTRIPCSRATC